MWVSSDVDLTVSKLATLRGDLNPDLTKHGIAVHTVLPGKGRRYFESSLEDDLYLIDAYFLPYYDDTGLHMLWAGFSHSVNQFAYDLALGLAENHSLSIHRRLSVQRNPVLAEEAVQAVDHFFEPFEIADVQDRIVPSIWDGFHPSESDRRVLEHARFLRPNDSVTGVDDASECDKDYRVVELNGDGRASGEIYPIPCRTYKNESILDKLSRILGIRRAILTELARVQEPAIETQYVEELDAALQWFTELPKDAIPREQQRREDVLKFMQDTQDFKIADAVVKARAVIASAALRPKLLAALRNYRASELVCLPSKPDSDAVRSFRDPGLGRYSYDEGGPILQPWKAKYTLVKGCSIPELQTQWRQFFITDARYVALC